MLNERRACRGVCFSVSADTTEARAILYQQLSGKAAATIVGRVQAAIGSARFHCDTLASCDDASLRGCGVSGNKLLALRDLSRREAAGEIPDLRRMSVMHQDEIVEALHPVCGIGRWTVEMMLMSRLGRPGQYFPRQRDFDTITAPELQAVEDRLNDRPRKVLGFRTPREVFYASLKRCTS